MNNKTTGQFITRCRKDLNLSQKELAEKLLAEGDGILRLTPTWVPRSFCRPGRRIRLHPDDYFALPGIATFRGNNFRNSAVYGTVEVTEKSLTKAWNKGIGALNGWPGSGWTGQPLIVQWDDATKQIMNLYSSKKEKQDLVEVIYATLDGYIYFYDLETGEYTRDPLFIGMAFKGAGALDPRGYPILYVGSGLEINNKYQAMFIINLLDCSVMYTFGCADPFSLRGALSFSHGAITEEMLQLLLDMLNKA